MIGNLQTLIVLEGHDEPSGNEQRATLTILEFHAMTRARAIQACSARDGVTQALTTKKSPNPFKTWRGISTKA